MKLLNTETYKGKNFIGNYIIKIWTIRVFSKIWRLSSNCLYGEINRDWKECIKRL